MKTRARIASFAVLLLLPATAAAYTIDGNLSDWGVCPGKYGQSDWVPDPGISWVEEDQSSYYLGPGYGGQAFDAEAMYTTCDSDYLYLAIVTGHPANGAWLGGTKYYPGDIAITFADKPGSNQFGLRTMSYWGLSKGHLYYTQSSNWGGGLWGSASNPAYMTGSPYHVGNVSFTYNNRYYGSKGHYVIEAAIPISYFGSYWGGSYTLHWTQTCGNDAINLTGPGGPSGPPPGVIPEPSTLLLLGLGLLGLGAGYRKRRRK